MDYDLSRLGNRQFEHLTQALFVKLLGGRVSVFGDGPDGGREASFKGSATWRIGQSDRTWDGYIVLQAKYLTREIGNPQNQTWLLNEVRKELQDWANKDGRRQRRGRLPQYLIIATNVRLSATEDGGVDSIENLLREFRDPTGRSFKGWDVWHYDKIRTYLDDAPNIRTTYSGFIFTGDILDRLHEQLGIRGTELDSVLTIHAAKELKSDGWIKLRQAGLDVDAPVSLSQVVIDLPVGTIVDDEYRTLNAAQHIVQHGDRILNNDNRLEGDPPRHVLIIGGPGQGKSTLGQIIAQRYRTEFMRKSISRFTPELSTLRDATAAALDGEGIRTPQNVRWPIRINMAELAEDAGRGGISLVRWIAEKLTARAAVTVHPRDLAVWLQRWPSVVVLDGLDEVANRHARTVVLEAIDDFLEEMAYGEADALVIVTTRPQGYGRELDASQFQALELELLDEKRAFKSAQRLAATRVHDDDDRRAEVLQRLRQAFQEDLTARLMTTPLQVAIMFLLLENNSRPPRDRHGLFEAYYKTIYAREVNKANSLAALLDEHRSHVDALHEEVGLRLQVLSESEGESDASLTSEHVEELARERLRSEDYEESQAVKIASEIVRATTDRLVLLVRQGQGEFGYELRSFQEYMAARSITNGESAHVLGRLRLVAPSAHWRNTWLFAAGRIFAMPNAEHMRKPLVALVGDLDDESYLTMEVAIGPELAMDLLDDDLARSSPGNRRKLMHLSLKLLDGPPLARAETLGRVLLNVARDDTAAYQKIRNELRAALMGTPAARATGRLVALAVGRGSGSLAVAGRQLTGRQDPDPLQRQLLRAWEGKDAEIGQAQLGEPRKLGEPLRAALQGEPLADSQARLANSLIYELSKTKLATLGESALALPPTRTPTAPSVARAIEDEAVSERIAMALASIRPEDWILYTVLRDQVRTAIQRRPVGEPLFRQMRPVDP